MGNNYELTVAGGGDNQNIQCSALNVETLTIGIQNGTSEDVSLAAFALDTDVAAAIAASDAADGDTSNTNEIQTLTSPDTSVGINQVGNNYELTVAGGGDNQNIQGSALNVETLTIGIQNGTSEDVSLAAFALDTDVTAAIAASDAADGDTSNTNEIQTLTSPDTSVGINQVGNNYELTVAGGGDNQNIQGSTFAGNTLTNRNPKRNLRGREPIGP